MRNDILVQLTEEESKRDEAWVSRMVTLITTEAVPVCSKSDYELGHNILFGNFPALLRDKLFSGKLMTTVKDKLNGDTVFFFERVRNAMIDERTSSGLNITVNSLDPEKSILKEKDKALLLNRRGIEEVLNQVTKNNGMPEERVTADDFHGNVDEFDKAGFDENDDDNVRDFFDSKWGLKQELLLQNPLNAIFRTNQVVRNYDRYINDILISLTTCSQSYVDEIEGKITIEHLYPYEVSALHPTGNNDEKGAQGFLVRKSTNMRGLLRRFGDTMNMSNNWQDLLAYINVSNSDNPYVGIIDEHVAYGEPMGKRTISMMDFLNHTVSYGYVEFRVVNQNTSLKGTTTNGNKLFVPYVNKTEAHDGWSVESKLKEDTYRAYFFDISTPRIIKWGKLYMQPLEGVYDEYSGFSIHVNRRKGVPMVQIMKPFYNIMQTAFTMFEMLVQDIKPDGYIYNYDNLVKIAEHVTTSTDAPTDVMNAIADLMNQFQDSPNRLSVVPTDDEGNILGGDPMGGIKRAENGLNKAAQELVKIMDWCELKTEIYLGTRGIEVADPRDGFKLSLENRKRSRASTQFIDFILLNHLEDISINTLSYVQDIAKYPDIPAYKHLASLIGDDKVKAIAKFKKSPHRYATFLDTFNNDIQLAEIREEAKMDMRQQRITLEQWAFIIKFDNINQIIFHLAQERKRADKAKQKEQLTLLQQQDANAEAAFQRQLKLEDKKGEWMRLARAEEAKGYTSAAQLNANASIERERMKNESQDKRLGATAINNINEIAEKAKEESQKPLI